MEYSDTKEKIALKSLLLFSKSGFDGVSVRDIAAAVGIKESSLYKHYASKAAILDSIFEQLSIRCRLAMDGMVGPDSAQHSETGEEDMVWVCIGLFHYFLDDELVSPFRRLLSIEQYKNARASALYKELFLDTPLQLYSGLFNALLAKGLIPYADARLLALEFYAPVYLLLTQSELSAKAVDTDEQLRLHVHMFYRQYCRGIK